MATFIDHVRCGGCDAGLTLASDSVVLQRYRRQPWLRHFWVRCDVCASHKLYWPTSRQMGLAERLNCRTVLDEAVPADVRTSYARCKGLPVPGSGRPPVDILNRDLGYLLCMLAATSGPTPAKVPAHSYLPASWSN